MTPEGTKTNGVRPLEDIPAQTITENGFWTLETNLYFSGIREVVEDNTQWLKPELVENEHFDR